MAKKKEQASKKARYILSYRKFFFFPFDEMIDINFLKKQKAYKKMLNCKQMYAII